MKYNRLFYTNCNYCGKQIIVDIPEKYKHWKNHGSFSCNDCVPENSSARNNFDESVFTDIRDKLNVKKRNENDKLKTWLEGL